MRKFIDVLGALAFAVVQVWHLKQAYADSQDRDEYRQQRAKARQQSTDKLLVLHEIAVCLNDVVIHLGTLAQAKERKGP